MSFFNKIEELEKRPWSADEQLRANTGLTSQEFSHPALGLIFLRYAEYRYELAKEKLASKQSTRRRGGGDIKSAIQAEGAMNVPDDALLSNLLKRSEDEDLGKYIKDALSKTYTQLSNRNLVNHLRNISINFGIKSNN